MLLLLSQSFRVHRRLTVRMASANSDIANSFLRAELSPSLLPTAPVNFLEVSFLPRVIPQIGYANQNVALGNELSTADVAEAPISFIFRNADSSKLHAILFVGWSFYS